MRNKKLKEIIQKTILEPLFKIISPNLFIYSIYILRLSLQQLHYTIILSNILLILSLLYPPKYFPNPKPLSQQTLNISIDSDFQKRIIQTHNYTKKVIEFRFRLKINQFKVITPKENKIKHSSALPHKLL